MLFLVSQFGFAQQDAWVYFTNKPNSQYFFDNPLEMLSQRALDRRATQNISLDMMDIPLHQPYLDQINVIVPVLAQSKWLNAVHVRGSESQINSLSNLEFVASIDFADHSLNLGGKPSQNLVPYSENNLVQVNFPYGNSANQIEMLNGHLLHQQNYTGSGKIIAVMDAGFPDVDIAQPFQRLRDNNQILGGYNFVDGNTDIYTSNNHGTLVLSTMGGYKANQLVGTAPDASYYLFITEDISDENPVEESYWVQAAEVADSLGVDVINTSLGYFSFSNPAYDHTYENLNGTTTFISRGANVAFSRGMVVVVSAGNSGETANPYISAPADATYALSVGAVDADGVYVDFSSIGPTPDGRVKPDVVAQGFQAVVANTFGNITTASGTSFSGPIMAGMVASFWQAVPNKTNSEIVQLIKESAHLFSNPTATLGYGIPDFSLALANALQISEYTQKSFVVSPNPMKNFVSFSFEGPSAEVNLYNNLGQLVRNFKTISEQKLFIEDLPEGLYFYDVSDNTFVQKGKILKL